MQTPIVFITDTIDDNARGRVTTRVQTLFGSTPSFIGVTYPNQLEAAGNLIDQLDALDGKPGVIFVNVAPRSVTGEHGGNRRGNENGTPFCYFHYGGTLVVATRDGLTLSLVKKFELVSAIRVVDLPKAVRTLRDLGYLDEQDIDRVIRTQFRSYEALPKLGAALHAGHVLPGVKEDMSGILDCPDAVWSVDGHGNCKTTLLVDEVAQDKTVTQWGELPRYQRLKDVPDRVTAVIVGSLGLGNRRFLEVVVQGGSAAAELGIRAGDRIH